MTIKTLVRPNLYRDSVALMRLAAELELMPGIEKASAIMATEANLAILAETGTTLDTIAPSPNDLLVVVLGSEESNVAAAIEQADARLEGEAAPLSSGESEPPRRPRSLVEAATASPSASLALISCPGEYATAEAMKALRLDLDAMIFSDNVRLEDEVALRDLAEAKGRLVMGPDCGTAIINGIPLGFANIVRRGTVGIIAASGTGLQHVACSLDRSGVGISQAIGTGGRDLSDVVGGTTMLRAIEMLSQDSGTESLVLISKPPGKAVASKVIERAGRAGKPVIVAFIGLEAPAEAPDNVTFAATLEDAAAFAVGVEAPPSTIDAATIAKLAGGFAATQRLLVGLYSGGTFCAETMAIAAPILGNMSLIGGTNTDEHVILDLGDDVYTRGRPHPMIDFEIRTKHIRAAAEDEKTAVILLDVVLGCGVHPDPASVLVPVIEEASEIAQINGRRLVFVGFVCGTEADPQRLSAQEAALSRAGVILEPSNAASVLTAISLLEEIRT